MPRLRLCCGVRGVAVTPQAAVLRLDHADCNVNVAQHWLPLTYPARTVRAAGQRV